MNARIGWQNLRTSEFLDSGDYLLITGTDFDNGRIKYGTCHYVEKKRFDQDTKIQLSTGSILITKDGTLGKVALVEELPKPATLNAGVFNVRVKDDAVLSYKYLYHYLKAPFLMKYVTANATGGTIKHLNQSILVDFPIPITEKLEQDRIAKLLDSLELSITLHQCKLEKLKLTKKALLQKLFPKNGKHIPEIRFKGFTDAWEQRKLGEFVKIISGDAPSTFISGRCIYVKVDDLNYSDRIQLSSSNLVNINPKAHLVNKGATIFPKRGAAIMTNKVRIMGKDGYLDTNMMALIPEEIDKDFLFTFIQKTGLYKIADTSTIPQINNKHIEPYMIQVPNDKEQECIGVVFEKIDKIITLHQ